MKKLGRIFRKYWKWIIGFVLVLLFLIFVKPWNWFVDNQIRSISQRVKFTMQGFGTDESDLFNLLQPLTSGQLESVFKDFGLQKYDYGGRWWFGSQYDLFGWFDKELNAKEKARMRDIWAKTDLEITF